MDTDKRSLKKPFPEAWGGTTISSFLDKAKRTKIGKLTTRWLDIERELSRLHKRRESFSGPHGDKVMQRMLDGHIEDAQNGADKLALEIADIPSRNAMDVICKLAVARRMQCGWKGEPEPDTLLSTSALQDMLRFVQFQARTAA